MSQEIELGWVDERVHVFALRNYLFRFDMLLGEVFRHTSLTVWHVDFEGFVARSRIQHHLHFLRMQLSTRHLLLRVLQAQFRSTHHRLLDEWRCLCPVLDALSAPYSCIGL